MKAFLLNFFVLFSFFNSFAQLDEKWITQFERSGFTESPDYKTTMAYFNQLAVASPYAEMVTFGVSPQGRKLNVLIVSKDKIFTAAEARASDKPVLMIMNGIHSGEINGKDASMLLLREILITGEKENYLDHVILLVIPIFSVDGHERRSPYGRINQIGPKEMGWRVTAQNINLNRDFLKADAPEMKAFIKLYTDWLPDFFVDVHSTDGADYQYQTTFAIEKHENVVPVIQNWVKNIFNPFLVEHVTEKGFLISPFVGFVDGDPRKGIYDWIPTPRFSNGYTPLQNRPGLLIESHVLKTYKERVFSTKAILESVLELLNNIPSEVKALGKYADAEVIKKYIEEGEPFPVTFKRTGKSVPFLFKGIEYKMVKSDISGDSIKIFTGEKFEEEVPYYNHGVGDKYVSVPEAYIIPQEWSEVIDILKLHGVEVEKINQPSQFLVEKIKFKNVSFPKEPYEGRFVPSFEYDKIKTSEYVREGDYIVKTNQRTLPVIIHLLEPDAPDSFLKWGYFNIIFERSEYYEEYAFEPIAQEMLDKDPKLREEFFYKISTDEEFANNPVARYDFLYERSPYYDSKHNVYPILRVID